MAKLVAFKVGDRVIQPRNHIWSPMEYVTSGDTSFDVLNISGGTNGIIIGPGVAPNSWYVDYGDGRHAYVDEKQIERISSPIQPLVLKPRRKLSL